MPMALTQCSTLAQVNSLIAKQAFQNSVIQDLKCYAANSRVDPL